MNRIAVILMILLPGFTNASAQSMLRVRLADNSQLNVSVDNRYFNKRGTAITVGELPYGRHKLRIFQHTEGRRGRGYEEEIFSGNVVTYEGMITLFVYDPNSRETDVSEQDIDKYTANHPPAHESDRFNEQYPDNGNRRVVNENDNYGSPKPSDGPVASPVPPEKMSTVTDAKMIDLKTKSDARKTDIDRMNMLKQELKSEKVAVSQVGAMMDWFNFESSKVEFAKWAFDYTIDKEYFIDLVGKLSYKNYQDELQGFIKGK